MRVSQKHFAPLTPQIFHILLALANRELHGYGIKDRIAQDTEGGLVLAAGTLYPALKRLVQAQLIEELRNSERQYRLTAKGRGALEAELRRLQGAVGVAERRLLAEKYKVRERFYE